jgi:hypothetical protein
MVFDDTTEKTGPQESVESQDKVRYQDMQSAVRFPLKLPVSFQATNGQHEGETRNISANGVLFQIDSDMPLGSAVEFTIAMPAEVLGSPADVMVNCRGRVVRCFEEEDRRWVGVVIDEYGFERR